MYSCEGLLSLLHIFGEFLVIGFTLFTGLLLVVAIVFFPLVVGTMRGWIAFYVTSVALFIFTVGLVICLIVPYITAYVVKGVSF